jgi:GNAT superfamily N-acetyltransferase
MAGHLSLEEDIKVRILVRQPLYLLLLMITDTDLPACRFLTATEATLLHQELKTTPNILGYTVSELRRWPDALVWESAGTLAAVCLCVELAEGWMEISAIYVLPAFRGHGLGRRLFTFAVQRAVLQNQQVCVLSRNPQVISWMQAEGLTVSDGLRRAPLPVRTHLRRHMAHPYRWAEALRKFPQICRCPPLVYGVLRTKSAS